MAAEIQTQKNTVATIGMRFSIIGLILLITIFFSWLGLILLFIGFILWIVGLFFKPRGKARVAVTIPLLVYIAWIVAWIYVWNSIKTPAVEFVNYVENKMSPIDPETLDDERFEYLLESEMNSMFKDMTEEEFKAMYKSSTWSNAISRWTYLIFGLAQQAFDSAWEKYENWEVPEVATENSLIDVDVWVNDSTNNEPTVSEKVEIFTQSEKNDIEQILNILE